jgi:hypothetical protein
MGCRTYRGTARPQGTLLAKAPRVALRVITKSPTVPGLASPQARRRRMAVTRCQRPRQRECPLKKDVLTVSVQQLPGSPG